MTSQPHVRPRLLFLNPPAPSVVIRDYYCSKTSRSNYLFPPSDFVMQSGILGEAFQLHFLDAVRDRLSPAATIDMVNELAPEIIFFLAGAVNHPGDLEFVATLAAPGRTLIGSGDIFLSAPGDWLRQYPFLDAVALDFTNHDLLHFLQNQPQLIRRMAYRTPAGEVVEVAEKPAEHAFSVGIPHHALFADFRYRFPFARQQKFSIFLTDFGCPFHCRFCVMASLPYGYRANQEALAELRSLNAQGISELFWMNQTFGVRRKATLELLAEMQNFTPLFSWTAFGRPDLLDEELLVAMKNGGCHTIIIGVENGSEEVLRQYRKEYTLPQIRAAFALCRQHGVRSVGTFILGLPGETPETIHATIRLAQELDCDFASFHTAVPRAGTPLRQEAVQSGKIARDDYTMDQAGSYITFTPEGMDQQTLLRLRRQAVRRFYLRPAFLLRHLLRRRSWYELTNMLYQGFFLIFGEALSRRPTKKTLTRPDGVDSGR